MKIMWMTLLAMTLAAPGFAMSADGCGAGSCKDCHSLTREEASGLLKEGVDQIVSVDFAEVPGLWAVEVEKGGKKYPIFIDFSKSYVVAGKIIRLKDRQEITAAKEARPEKVDISRIPLDDALLLGSPRAKTQVIVFTDPECPYCKRIHEELKEVVRLDPDIAFQIKLYPLKMHPNAYSIAKSILCNDSLEMLEASFAGKPVPPPLCETPVVDETIALVRELGINSTPTLVLPDGQVLPGFKKAADLLQRLGSRVAAQTGK